MDAGGTATLDPKRKASLKKRERRAKRNPGKKEFDGGFDAPPQEQDDFDMSDLNKIKNTQKRRKLDHGLRAETDTITSNLSAAGLTCHIPQSDREEAKRARELNVKGSTEVLHNTTDKNMNTSGSKKAITTGRNEGESMSAFKKRVDRETREILLKEVKSELSIKKSTTKSEKKKAFLDKKKNMKKGRNRKKHQYQRDDDSDDNIAGDSNNFVTGERAVAGLNDEQVERPPIFTILPRGAKPKVKSLEPQIDTDGTGAASATDEEKQARERRTMEIMRNKVIASYALMKAKRKHKF